MQEYIENNKFIGKQILVFSADWCPDCIILKQYIDEVVAENGQWEFIYINTEKHLDIANEYNILGIPSFVALIDGEVVDTLISKEAKPKQLINMWIQGIE